MRIFSASQWLCETKQERMNDGGHYSVDNEAVGGYSILEATMTITPNMCKLSVVDRSPTWVKNSETCL